MTIPLFRLQERGWESAEEEEEEARPERNSNFSECLQRGSGEITWKSPAKGIGDRREDGLERREANKPTSSTVSNNVADEGGKAARFSGKAKKVGTGSKLSGRS